MNTTAHPVAPEDVMALLDGELSAAEAQAVSAHLDRCAECSALAEQFRSTSLSLSRWNVEAVPARLEHSVTSAAVKAGSGVKIGKREPLYSRQLLELEAVGPWEWRHAGGAIACAGHFLANLAPLSAGSNVRNVLSGQAAHRKGEFCRKQCR